MPHYFGGPACPNTQLRLTALARGCTFIGSVWQEKLHDQPHYQGHK